MKISEKDRVFSIVYLFIQNLGMDMKVEVALSRNTKRRAKRRRTGRKGRVRKQGREHIQEITYTYRTMSLWNRISHIVL